MKKYIIAIMLSATVGLSAFAPVEESFQGTIRYTMASSGVVPETVANKLGSYIDISFLGQDVKLMGDGPFKGAIFLKKEQSKMFIVRSDQKNIYQLDYSDTRIPASTLKSTVTQTRESAVIAGYTCQKYEVRYSGITTNFWTTSKISNTTWAGSTAFGNYLKLPSQVQGYPLKVEFIAPTFTITATATVVDKSLPAAQGFEIPKEMNLKEL